MMVWSGTFLLRSNPSGLLTGGYVALREPKFATLRSANFTYPQNVK